jgi:predicted GIY-YIG superfamily endonuclease
MNAYRTLAAEKYKTHVQQHQQQQQQQQATPTPTVGAVDKQDEKMYIYVLQCARGKYYVGETHNVEERFAQHCGRAGASSSSSSSSSGALAGATWTKKYEPIQVIKQFVKQSVHDEDNTTLDYMTEHGIRNVRGGSFCMVHLPRHIRRTIKQRLATIKHLCYRCKKPGHCANSCPSPTPSNKTSWIDHDSEEDEKDQHPNPTQNTLSQSTSGALFTFDSTDRAPLPQSAPECLMDPSTSLPLPVVGLPRGLKLLSARPPKPYHKIVCTRCARSGHAVNQCFAKFHLNGSTLPVRL